MAKVKELLTKAKDGTIGAEEKALLLASVAAASDNTLPEDVTAIVLQKGGFQRLVEALG
jgi:hypothetical protein